MNYILIAKLNAKNKYEDYQILEYDQINPPTIQSGYQKTFGPANLADCVENLKSATGSTSWQRLTYAEYVVIFLVTVLFVFFIMYQVAGFNLQGIQFDSAGKALNTQDDNARTLITFLVAVGTIAIAFLATMTAMVIREYKERFDAAKEVLVVLIGILGTIVGFYFGTASIASKPAANTNTSTPSLTRSPTSGNTSGGATPIPTQANTNG